MVCSHRKFLLKPLTKEAVSWILPLEQASNLIEYNNNLNKK
jgi:hypothetical protein